MDDEDDYDMDDPLSPSNEADWEDPLAPDDADLDNIPDDQEDDDDGF